MTRIGPNNAPTDTRRVKTGVSSMPSLPWPSSQDAVLERAPRPVRTHAFVKSSGSAGGHRRVGRAAGRITSAPPDCRAAPIDAGGRPGKAVTNDPIRTAADERTKPAKPQPAKQGTRPRQAGGEDHPDQFAAPERVKLLPTGNIADQGWLAGGSLGVRTLCLNKDQSIYAEGEPATFCYRILAGCVRMVKLMEDGRRQITEFLLQGDLLGLDTLEAYDLTAEAVIPTVLRRYKRAAVDALADRDPAVARGLRGFAVLRLREAWDRMTLLGRKTAMERIASFLLEMTVRIPRAGHDHMTLPMGRADIADHLGLTTETVCRVLRCLRQDGTIDTSRGADGARITVRDPVTLRALAFAAPTGARRERRRDADGDPLAPIDACGSQPQGGLGWERPDSRGPLISTVAAFLA